MEKQKGQLQRKEDQQNSRISLRWIGVGVEFGGVCGLFAYIGYQADKRYGTEPWLVVTGIMVAIIGMTYLMIKETSRWGK